MTDKQFDFITRELQKQLEDAIRENTHVADFYMPDTSCICTDVLEKIIRVIFNQVLELEEET